MAKKSIISHVVADGVLTFTVDGAGTFSVPMATLSDDIRDRALVHGLVQKISDAAAISKSELPADATEAANVKMSAMQSVAERIVDGDWSKRSGDGTGPVAGIIYRAFEEWALALAAKGKKTVTSAAIRAVYDAKDRAEQLALRNVPEISTIIERMKSERGTGATAVDTAALLADLGI